MPEHRFPVEAGHILLFARAMGDPNPIYADADYAQTTEVGGIIAPPTFERASVQFDPSYHLRPKSGEPWFGSGREPSGGPHPQAPEGGTAMHAEQHYEYHRPLRPGDLLTVKTRPGKRWERAGRRAGTLSFAETVHDYYDLHGDLVMTARHIRVRTERVVDQEEERA